MNINNRYKGKIGEDIACSFIEKKDFVVLDRNYQKKWGEIDIVAKKGDIIHFFEVKSIIVQSLNISYEGYRPEENVHGLKIRNIRRMVETYFFEKGINAEKSFNFHVLVVFKDIKTRRARVKWIENLIL